MHDSTDTATKSRSRPRCGPHASSDISPEQQVVADVISTFGTQGRLAALLKIDQSSISLWLKRGTIPAKRQRHLIKISREMFAAGEVTRILAPEDFFPRAPEPGDPPDAA